MNTKTITLPTDQWKKILEAVENHNDCGSEDCGYKSKELSEAAAALECAIKQKNAQDKLDEIRAEVEVSCDGAPDANALAKQANRIMQIITEG